MHVQLRSMQSFGQVLCKTPTERSKRTMHLERCSDWRYCLGDRTKTWLSAFKFSSWVSKLSTVFVNGTWTVPVCARIFPTTDDSEWRLSIGRDTWPQVTELSDLFDFSDYQRRRIVKSDCLLSENRTLSTWCCCIVYLSTHFSSSNRVKYVQRDN